VHFCTTEAKPNSNPNTNPNSNPNSTNPTYHTDPTKPYYLTMYGAHGSWKTRSGAEVQDSPVC